MAQMVVCAKQRLPKNTPHGDARGEHTAMFQRLATLTHEMWGLPTLVTLSACLQCPTLRVQSTALQSIEDS